MLGLRWWVSGGLDLAARKRTNLEDTLCTNGKHGSIKERTFPCDIFFSFLLRFDVFDQMSLDAIVKSPQSGQG